MEEFRDILGYEGLYQVSNLGNVKSLPRVRNHRNNTSYYSKEKILKPYLTAGYFAVTLYQDSYKRTRMIHQLVAESFLSHTPCGHSLVVDHINNDKTDNRVDNLQLITQRENASKDVKNKTSKYTGVSLAKASNKWVSKIMINEKPIVIGHFEKEYDAHVAYQNKLLSLSN